MTLGHTVEGGASFVQQSPGVVHLPERQRQDGREMAGTDGDRRCDPACASAAVERRCALGQSWAISMKIDS